MSNRLHVEILGFTFNEFGVYFKISSTTVGNFPAVLNFNRLFLKFNWFICNQLPILPDSTHSRLLLLTLSTLKFKLFFF